MRVLSIVALALLAASPGLRSQSSTISPKDWIKGGNATDDIPYSWYPTRYQQVHDAAGWDNQAAIKVDKLRHRMGSGFADGSLGGETVEVAVWLAHAAKGIDSQSCTGAFDKNLDQTTLKKVVTRAKFVLPKLNNTGWGVQFPFDSGVTFAWGNPGVDLVLEVRVYGNDVGSWFSYPLDAGLVGAGSSVTNGSHAGCPSSNSKVPELHGLPSHLRVGDRANQHYGYAQVPSLFGILTLGGTSLNLTVPGTTCAVVNDIVHPYLARADTSLGGFISFPLPINDDAGLGDLSYMCQLFFLDQNANGVGVTSSRGLVNTIAPRPTASVTRIFASDSSYQTSPDNQTTGFVDRDHGLLTCLSN